MTQRAKWIPAFAGMTEFWRRALPPSHQARGGILTGSGRHSRESGNPCRSIPSAVSRFQCSGFTAPRSAMHPWRTQAHSVRHASNRDATGFLDSRFRGNDGVSAPRLSPSRQARGGILTGSGRHSRESGNPCRSIPSAVSRFQCSGFTAPRSAMHPWRTQAHSVRHASNRDATGFLDSRFRGNDGVSAPRLSPSRQARGGIPTGSGRHSRESGNPFRSLRHLSNRCMTPLRGMVR